MRILLIKRVTLVVFIGSLCALAVALGIPVAQVAKLVSPETREYWAGSPDIIWQVQTRSKMIALTFDDGPSPTFTPEILDIFKKNKVQGTFFVIATEAEKHPGIVSRMVSEGHEIANHTYHHKYLYRLTAEEVKKELILAEKAITQAAGVKPKLFRPPGGYYNEEIVEAARELGYKVIIWSWKQQSMDWKNPGTQAIISKVLQDAASGGIIVFHDRGGNRTQTVQALQPIIAGLKEKGFRLVTVSAMLRDAATK